MVSIAHHSRECNDGWHCSWGVDHNWIFLLVVPAKTVSISSKLNSKGGAIVLAWMTSILVSFIRLAMVVWRLETDLFVKFLAIKMSNMLGIRYFSALSVLRTVHGFFTAERVSYVPHTALYSIALHCHRMLLLGKQKCTHDCQFL